MGYNEYAKLSRRQRESLVLERLKQNRIWEDLNLLEKEFSIEYVNSLSQKEGVINVRNNGK